MCSTNTLLSTHNCVLPVCFLPLCASFETRAHRGHWVPILRHMPFLRFHPGLQCSSLFRPSVRLDTTRLLLSRRVHCLLCCCFSLTTDACLAHHVWKATGKKKKGSSELDSHSGRNDLAGREVSVAAVTSQRADPPPELYIF